MIKVLVAEARGLLRDGIVAMLEMEQRFEIVAAVAQPRELLGVAASQQPQLILFEPPVADAEGGARLVRRLKELAPRARMVVLTAQNRADFIHATLRAGAHACVLKREGKQELLTAIATVMRGGRYRSPAAVACLESGIAAAVVPAAAVPRDALSLREQQVLGMIAAGARTREIATHLSLSAKTIEKHRSRLMQKLGLRGVAGVTAYAIQNGFVRAVAAAH